jgi:hypothetical protein
MAKRTLSLSLIAAALLAGVAFAHPATEQFIPIGQSPHAVTMQGKVSAVAEPAAADGVSSIAMTTPAAPEALNYVVNPQTRIYIDRSAHGRASTLGSMADLQPGRDIEVAVSASDTSTALWIKVRAEN